MDVSPPRPQADGGVRADETEGPVSPPKGCFPNFFSRKKGSRGGTKRRKRGLRLGRSASGDARPTPIISPVAKGAADGSPTHAPDAATPAASTVSTATAGSSYMTDHHDVRAGDSSVASLEDGYPLAPPGLPCVVNGASTLVQGSMVAFKSPVVIQEQAAGRAMAGGSVSRQSSAGEPPTPPVLGQGIQRSFSGGGALWKMGASLSRGLSMEDLNGMFSRQGSKMKRSMSRRMSLEELIIPDDFEHTDAPDGPPLHPRFLPMVSNGLARIALHAKVQDMTPATWDVCFSFLKPEEVARIMRYKFDKDRRLALGSCLLQRAVIHWTFGIPYHEIDIQRTEKGKPFFVLPETVRQGFENWNFNVSHHGEYVAIASEPTLLVGLDIMNSKERPRSRANSDQFFKVFRKQLSHQEWGSIYEAEDEDARLERFYRQWALKEAFIKAIGSGLTMSPRRIEIVNLDNTPRPNSDKPYDRADLRIDGLSRPNWKFKFHKLDDAHVACLSRGPPSDAIPEYRQTLKVQDVTSSPLRYGLESIQPEFENICLRELIPACRLAEYDATMPLPDSPVFGEMEDEADISGFGDH